MKKKAFPIMALLATAAFLPMLPTVIYADPDLSINIVERFTLASGNSMDEGQILHVALDPASPAVLMFDVSVSPSSAVIVPSEYPDGVWPRGARYMAEAGLFTWRLSEIPAGTSFPAAFGLMFTAEDPSTGESVEKSVLVVIEDTPATPTIEFDRDGYLVGDTALITVIDNSANLNGLVQDIIPESNVQIRTTSSIGGITQTINVQLEESPDDARKFLGTFVVQAGSQMSAHYRGSSDIADIGLAMWFNDDDKYDLSETPKIIVRDPEANLSPDVADTIIVKLRGQRQGQHSVPLVENGTNTGFFVRDLKLIERGHRGLEGEVYKVRTSVGNVLTVSYKDQMISAEIIKPKFEFGRAKYSNFEYATINVIDKAANKDDTTRDAISVSVTSDSDKQPVMNVLLESGPNSATFSSMNGIVLTNDSSFRELIPQSLLVEDGDVLTASYNGITIHSFADFSSLPFPWPPPGLNGTGGSGAPPTTAVGIFSDLNILTCDSYGGDLDHDGICNSWEYPTTGGYLKIPYGGTTHSFTFSCDPDCPAEDHMDVYVEHDYIGAMQPETTALSAVKTKFNSASITNIDGTNGIRLHNKVSNSIAWLGLLYTWSGGAGAADAYTEIKNTKFGLFGTESYNRNKVYAWGQVAHYAFWANKQQHNQGSSGIAEIVGNDMIISLGNFTNSVDQQQGTFMHELGHNLGLDHGGGLTAHPLTSDPADYSWLEGSSTSCKPNYLSVMSHPRQFTNSFTGNTLEYSKATLTPSTIKNNLDQLDESDPPHQASGTATILYGVENDAYNPGGTHYYDPNVPIGPSNPINLPRNPKVFAVPWNIVELDWDDNGSINDGPSTEYPSSIYGNNDVQDIGIHRCDPASNPPPASKILRGFKDWSSSALVLDFRSHNTAGMASGSILQTPGLSIEQWREIRVLGIHSTDVAVQNLNTHYISDADVEAMHSLLVAEDGNIASLVQFDNLDKALEALEELRKNLDSAKGGDPNDDFIDEEVEGEDSEMEEAGVLDLVDNNIAYLKVELDRWFHPVPNTFNITSHLNGNVYTIRGTSDTIASATDTFAIDLLHEELLLDLIGKGSIEITIPQELAEEITDVTMTSTGAHIPFTTLSSGIDDEITILLEDVEYYPREVSLSFAEPPPPGVTYDIAPGAPTLKDVMGNLIDEVSADEQIIVSSTIMNNLDHDQPYTAIMEVRDSTGVTVFLAWQTGKLDASSASEVGLSWTPTAPGDYTIRVFVISDLLIPDVLSPVVESGITVR